MKSTLLADIERGFEALKSRLDFATRVNFLDNELTQAREELEALKKSQQSSVKALYTCHSNLLDRLQTTKEELDKRMESLESQMDSRIQAALSIKTADIEEMMQTVLLQTQAMEEVHRRLGIFETTNSQQIQSESQGMNTQRPSYYNTSEHPLSNESNIDLIPLQVLRNIPAGVLYSHSSSTSELNGATHKSPYKVISFIESSEDEEEKEGELQAHSLILSDWKKEEENSVLETKFLTTEAKQKSLVKQVPAEIFPQKIEFVEVPTFKAAPITQTSAPR